MNKIKVIAKRPDSDFYVTWISDTLENLQKFVGGYIEAVPIVRLYGEPHIVVICDEDGRLKGEQYCCTIAGTHYVGAILISGVKDGEFVSLEDDIVKQLLRGLKNER